MALLGKAALAMWWDMSAAERSDFEHWHAHEHFPERLAIPGFRRASRWMHAGGGEGVFVMYELEDPAVLASPAYMARLNAPTAWSQRLMPEHRHMVRSQCEVLESRGALTARHALTVRLSPVPGQAEPLRAALRSLGDSVAMQPGLVGLHLLRHQAPAIAPTEEQRIRGLADRGADWVLVACGYDVGAVQTLSESALSDTQLQAWGAAAGSVERGVYALAYSAVAGDMA